ncbi:RING finger protein 17 isoform X2 [Ixodes scapularis]
MFQMETSFKCPSCSQSYSSREHRGSRLPRILKCGHTCCEACVRSRSSQTRVCTCPVCKEQQAFSDVSSIQDLLLDSYALGAEAASTKHSQMTQRILSSEPLSLTMKWPEPNKKTARTVSCDECGDREASCRCDTCPSNYCKFCFEQVHKTGKTMKRHQPKRLEASVVAAPPPMCQEHERVMEFFCQTDGTLICSFCVVMGTHKLHDVVAILDQNKACMDQLRPTLEEATKSYHGLKRTAKKLENILSGVHGNYQTLAQDVHSHFQHLHCLLQLRSHQLLSDIKKIDGDYTQGLQEELKGVLAKIKEFQAVRKDVADAVSSSDPSNAAYLLDKLKSFRNLPCFLVNDFQEHRPTFEVMYDPSISEVLRSYGEMRFTMPEKLSFVSSKDLPEDYIQDELDETDTESSSSVGKLEEISTSASSISGDSMLPASGSDDTLSGKRVMVSHVRDPSLFYVQVTSLAAKLQRMQAEINAYCMSLGSRLNPDEEPRAGKMYLAQFLLDNNWYRCRVLRVVRCDLDVVDGASFSQSSFKVEVFYVDYGNSEVVPLSRLRVMVPVFERLPHLALKCSLYNLATTKGDFHWKKESIAMFARLTEHRRLILMVAEHSADTYHVDLLDTDGDSGFSGSRTSICDALVFLGMATYHLPVHSESKRANPRRQFYSPQELHPGQVMNVFVSCINDPNRMFIQELGSNVEYLHSMINELQEHCNKRSAEMDIVYAPQVGTVCLAQFLPDQLWYRAQVVALPGGAQVEVLYVDYGNKDVVPGLSVRKIPDRFMRLPIQAVQVALADVAPLAGNSWSNEAKNKLTKLTSSRSLKMKVHSATGPKGFPNVTLYIPGKEDFDLCVNALLVQEKVAVSTGPLSMMVEVPRVRTPSTGAQALSLVDVFEETSRANSRKKRQVKESCGSPPNGAEALLAALEMSAHSAHQMAPSSSRPPPSENYVAMDVAHAESPAGFYVHLAAQKAGLKSIAAELQQACSVAENHPDLSWEAGDWCAVKHTTGWERGCVESAAEDVQVRLIDRGAVVTVPKSEVLPLEKSLAELPPLVTKCHLADMVPAGGSKNWSKTADEHFSEVLRSAEKVYLVELGEETGGSLPVDLMMERTIDAGALEPMRREYKSVREQLKEAGYGFITKRSYESSSSSKEPKSTLVSQEARPPSATSSCPPSASARQVEPGDLSLTMAAQFQSLATDATGKTDAGMKRPILLSPEAIMMLASSIMPNESEEEALKQTEGPTGNEATEEHSKAPEEVLEAKPKHRLDSTKQKDAQEEAQEEALREFPKKPSRKESKESSRKESKESSRKESKESSRKESKESSRKKSKEASQQPLRETSGESPETALKLGLEKDTVKVIPKATSMVGLKRMTEDTSQVTVTETPKRTLEETVKKTPKEPPRKALKETSLRTPKETSKESSAVTPKLGPKRLAKDTPKATPEAIAKQVEDTSEGTAKETVEQILRETSGDPPEEKIAEKTTETALDEPTLRRSPEGTKAIPTAEALAGGDIEPDKLVEDTKQPSGILDEDKKDGKFVICLADSESDLSSEDGELDSFRLIHDDTDPVDWLERPFPAEKQLLVMPSHIDEDAVIYVQVLGKDIELYKAMKEALTDTYSELPAQQHKTLRLGQACVARYSLDEKYYRAKILNSGEKGIEVRFVDYGTTEYVNPDFIFPELMFEDVPKLCIEVEFYGLKPFSTSGRWPLTVLDTLHYMLVEQNCSMVVKKLPTENARAKVLLFLPDGVSMYDFMLEAGIAVRNEEEPIEQNGEVSCEAVPCPYEPVAFPERGVFPVLVTHLEDVTRGSVQLSKVAHASNQEQRKMNASVDAFRAMADDLQRVAVDCPPLVQASRGTPCICQYSYDKRWYRALVTDVRKKKVAILYVDFGNSEKVSMSKLVALPGKFLSIPMQARPCRFYGVSPGENSAKAVDMLSNILFESGNEGFLARVKNMDSDPIEIDLLDSSLELVYQPLADEGYITLDRTE